MRDCHLPSSQRAFVDSHTNKFRDRDPQLGAWSGLRSSRAGYPAPAHPSTLRRLGRLSSALLGLCVLAACKPNAPGTHESRTRTADSDGSVRSEPTTPKRQRLEIAAFGRVTGAIAPCGCTAEPLGGLQYSFGYLQTMGEAASRIVVEPGSLLYADPQGPSANVTEAQWAQAEQRAKALHEQFASLGDGLISALGPTDLSAPQGWAELERRPLTRILANLAGEVDRSALPAVPATRVIEKAGLRIGATAVVQPSLGAAIPAFPKLSAPAPALAQAVQKLVAIGTDLIVVTVHGDRELAEKLADEVTGIDVIVLGGPIENHDTARLGAAPRLRGRTWILQPGDQQQSLTRLSLEFDSSLLAQTGVADRLPPAKQWRLRDGDAARKKQAQRVRARLERFRGAPDADPNFLKNLERQLAELEHPNPKSSTSAPVQATIQQVKITCHMAKESSAQAKIDAYDGWVAKANEARFKDVHAPAPEPGQAHYSGIDSCEDCHEEAVEFWRSTVHARAYETLARDDKEFDLACIGCHVTGFRKPGGSEVVRNLGLRDVQCEQCHGPGSIHVEDADSDSIRLNSPDSVCLECHTPEHSDTFSYIAYMRDMLGPGHGQEARAKLGPGPTGHELRAAALKKAGGSCKKM